MVRMRKWRELRERVTELETELETAVNNNTGLKVKVLNESMREERSKIVMLESELERAARENTELEGELVTLSDKVKEEGARNRELWLLHCEKLAEYDEHIASKEERIEALESQLAALETTPRGHGSLEPHTVPGRSVKESLAGAGPSPTHESDGIRHTRWEPSDTGRSTLAPARSLPSSRPGLRGTLPDV